MEKDKTKKEPKLLPQSSKMQIKLFDPNDGSLLSHRLVEQSTELTLGPKEVHKGPMTIEVNLTNQEGVQALIEWLKKVNGDLPITTTKKPASTTKTLDKMLSDKEPLLDLLKNLKAKATSQEKLLAELRAYNFRFLDYQAVLDMGWAKPGMIELRERDSDYQFMARLVKEAKDPANDKYDFRLTFGIKIVGEKTERVRVYLWGKYSETLTIPWEKAKSHNFKKVERLMTFPEWMDYTERRKWRLEHRKFERLLAEVPDAEKQAFTDKFEFSKSYLKAKPYVKVN